MGPQRAGEPGLIFGSDEAPQRFTSALLVHGDCLVHFLDVVDLFGPCIMHFPPVRALSFSAKPK